MFRSTRDLAAQASIASSVNILLGIWLIASPWVFDFSGRPAVLSSVFLGVFIALLAAIRLATLHSSAALSGFNLLLALGTVAAPWELGYEANTGALVNDLIVGVLVAALAIWSASATVVAQRRSAG